MSSGNGKDAYKILGKKITKKVIKKIIKVADIIVKMLLFSKSVADKISDSEEKINPAFASLKDLL